MKGIILHGGHGTRLRPLTHTGPKQLLPIANKPMSQYCIESLKEAGISEIAIIIGGPGAFKVKEYYDNGEFLDVKLTYIEQDEPKGISHAIGLCKKFVNNEKFVVFLGDNIIQRSIKDFVEKFEESNDDAKILLCEVDNPSRFGIAEIKNKKIVKIVEKPKVPPSNYAVTGIYFLTPKIFEIIDDLKPSWRNELEITDALDILIKKKNLISYEIITSYWKDTGTPEDIINANKTVLEKCEAKIISKIPKQVKKKGMVIIEDDVIIEDGVELIGPVLIGKNSILRKKSKIGPNASIGEKCEVEEAEINNSIIMNNSKIFGNIKIKNSIIASNSEIISQIESSEKTFLLGEGTKIYL